MDEKRNKELTEVLEKMNWVIDYVMALSRHVSELERENARLREVLKSKGWL